MRAKKIFAIALTILATTAVLTTAEAQPRERDVIYVYPACVPTDNAICVPRVRPSTVIKKYPYGMLKQDYHPYGMAGVRDRDYFDYEPRDKVLPWEALGQYPVVHRID